VRPDAPPERATVRSSPGAPLPPRSARTMLSLSPARTMRRWLRLSLMVLLFAAIADLPDAEAQRRRGRRGGGGGGFASGNSLFGPRGMKRGGRAAKAAADAPPPAAPKAIAAPKGGRLAADESRYLKLLADIDRRLAEDARERSRSEQRTDALGFELPRIAETGQVDWVAVQRPIFETADYDSSGWLSFREVRDSLGVQRDEFALYDHDRDGRIGSREFSARYADVVVRTGSFRIPKPKDDAIRSLPRTAEQLRNAFDRDSDGALQVSEIGTMLGEYRRRELDPGVLLETLDQDASGAIDGAELFQLGRVLTATFLLPSDDEVDRPRSRSVEELFGRATPRPGLSSIEGPPWIPGPVPHFRRLDWNGDGFVTGDELHVLQGGASLGTRLGAVLAALDLDEDGRIAEREFLTALSTLRK
jgi:Ca2+-binding EF-hand superfamily protein